MKAEFKKYYVKDEDSGRLLEMYDFQLIPENDADTKILDEWEENDFYTDIYRTKENTIQKGIQKGE